VSKGVDIHYKAEYTTPEFEKIAENKEIIIYLKSFKFKI